MIYECSFDFSIIKPKKSQIIGKSGIIELTTDREITDDEIDVLKTDKIFLSNIATHLNTILKQKNVFMVTVKSITQKNN